MIKTNLLNLDLGKNPGAERIIIGPFTIALKQDYEKKRALLEEKIDVETAEISYTKAENSVLLKSNLRKPPNAIWDIFYILSYLTGRVVITREQNYRFITQYSGGNEIVEKHDLFEAMNLAWENRYNFENDNEKRPLWYYFEYIQNSEIENQLIFASIAFEIIQEITLKEVKLDDGVDSEMVKLSSLKKELKKIITKSDISNQLKTPLLNNIGNWSSKKSVEGIRRYLFERRFLHDIQVNDDVRDRIQFINRLRNSILHRGQVAEPQNNISMEQIFNFSSQLIPGFIEDYLNSKFKIEHFHLVRQTHENMKGFLYTGKYPGIKWSIPL